MALKDWKKSKLGYNIWKSDRTDAKLRIIKDPDLTGKYPTYDIVVVKAFKRIILKTERTKSAAMRFAKSYMRKH